MPLTEVLERLFNLLMRESQDDFSWQQRSVQPVFVVVSEHGVGAERVVGLTL